MVKSNNWVPLFSGGRAPLVSKSDTPNFLRTELHPVLAGFKIGNLNSRTPFPFAFKPNIQRTTLWGLKEAPCIASSACSQGSLTQVKALWHGSDLVARDGSMIFLASGSTRALVAPISLACLADFFAPVFVFEATASRLVLA